VRYVSQLMGRSLIRIGVVAVVAAAAAVGVWWFAVRDSSSGKQAAGAQSSTAAVSGTTLRSLTAALGRPIYWAGPRRGVTYEFTETADRRIYVRYLPAGVRAGSSSPYLTVASYPFVNAYAATAGAAGKPGAVKLRAAGGAVAFYEKSRPTNVYVAYPGSDVQIEVFDPTGQAARRLVTSGRITQVSGSTQTPTVQARAVRTTPAGLKKLAAQLGHPIYWLGPRSGTTLELTRTPDGRVYLRYLAPGTPVGSARPYLSIATYPVAQAAAATKAEAKKAGAVKIKLPGGAIAFYTRARPTNVYVAYPGTNAQIEVYDPASRNGARQLVAAGKVEPAS
jgi:hypothetical protein